MGLAKSAIQRVRFYTAASLLLALAVQAAVVRLDKKDSKSTNQVLETTVRAEACISNATHCHCSRSTHGTGTCIKPVVGDETKCRLGPCAGGLRCDCQATTVCKKESSITYLAAESTDEEQFSCSQKETMAPAKMIGYSADFEIAANDAFTLFVDNVAIASGSGSGTYTATAEIYAGTLIAIEVRNSDSTSPAAIKLQYVLDGTYHTIDE